MFRSAGQFVTVLDMSDSPGNEAADAHQEVRTDCRHYSRRTLSPTEVVQRCRLDMAEPMPFACPPHCLFFEPRPYIDGGSGTFS